MNRTESCLRTWKIKAAAARERLERIRRVLELNESAQNKVDLIQMILDE